MVIAVFGESCTGKSTLAAALKARIGAQMYAGKDYLRLEKNADIARRTFAKMLAMPDAQIIYVISEPEQLSLLPDNCLRVYMTAGIDVIKRRMAGRMGGALPPRVAEMLDKKHGMFDGAAHDVHLADGAYEMDTACARIEEMARG